MELECQNCKKEISFSVARASMNYLRKQLCIVCQVKEVEKSYSKQPVLRDQKLKELSKYI
jgi:hypothetical protein